LAWNFRPDETALLSVVVLAGSPAMQELLHSPVVDLGLAAWTAAAYYALVRSDEFRRWPGALAFGALCAAGLLHDVLEDTQIPHETFKKEFGDEIYTLVAGVTKIETLHFSSRDEAQAENWRKMILATAKDIRVIVIKLADRLHNMRTLNFLTNEKQLEISHETLSLYAPLAQRLGIFSLKSELEDLSFKYLYPQEYNDLVHRMRDTQDERDRFVGRLIAPLQEKLREDGIKARVYGRSKHRSTGS